jgi:hypothetical protein
MGHIACLGRAMSRFGFILAFAFGVITTDAAPTGQDVITGCLPLTIDDALPFHSPTFAEYPVLGVFQGPPAPINLASHPLARRFKTMLRKGAAERSELRRPLQDRIVGMWLGV